MNYKVKNENMAFSLFNHISGLPIYLMSFVSFSYSINQMFKIPIFRIDEQLSISYTVLLDSLYNLKTPTILIVFLITFMFSLYSFFCKSCSQSRESYDLDLEKEKSLKLRYRILISICLVLFVYFVGWFFPNIRNKANGLNSFLLSSMSLVLIPSIFRMIYKAKNDLQYKDYHHVIFGGFVVFIVIWNMFAGTNLFLKKVKNSKEDRGFLVTQFMDKKYLMSCEQSTRGRVYLYSSTAKKTEISIAKKSVVDYICDNESLSLSDFYNI